MAPRSFSGLQRWLAEALQRRLAPARVGVHTWDGRSWYRGSEPPIGALVVGNAQTLRRLITNPDLYFGEAYMAGTLDVQGNLTRVLEALSRTVLLPTLRERLRLRFMPRNTPGRSQRNVHHHYDLGNSFYKAWLDDQLVYTCAYFETREHTLERAQIAKMDLVCRKLQLRPGETVIEAGCGWGALAMHMARHYGVRVKAFNISREQMSYARARAAHEGLTGQVELIEDDYRNVRGTCDAFVSVGMLEHVGFKHFESLASVINRVLPPQTGRGLVHFIGRDIRRPLNAWIQRRIFPGGYPPTLADVAEHILAPARMSILDVENLRLHYALTLSHWFRRFSAIGNQVRAQYGEEFRRAWELYLAGSEAAFASGCLQLFQVVFTPLGAAPPYWTRAGIYQAEPHMQVEVAVREGRR